jgi:hypothetical protein
MGNITSVMRLKNKQFIVTIPHAMADAMKLIKGSKLEWLFDRGDVIVRKV